MSQGPGPAGRIAQFFIDSKLTPLIIFGSILLGLAAVYALPREEEPQIIVPMIDIFVGMPGAGSKEIEERVAKPMEKLLWEIPGVEYIYSTSSPGQCMAIVRFKVGVDADWYMEDPRPRVDLLVDKEKAALHGIQTLQVDEALRIALAGREAGLLHDPLEKEDLGILVRLPLEERSGIERLTAIKLPGADGSLVPLSDLLEVEKRQADRSIYHKNLMPVVYVTADVAGERESPVYAILDMKKKIEAIQVEEGYGIEQYSASIPKDDRRLSLKWDGEWQITYEVFRDLGIAFGVVLVLIFVLVVGWFKSLSTPAVIMAAIPFSLIGILPAHGLMNAFFTATSMIGFIAGAGIVVRNSIILVDFIELRLDQGMPLDQAVIDAGAVRFRPMMLTAAAVVVAASVILFDPIFQGLAISLMAGEVASLLLSRMTVPILYFLDKRWEVAHGHGGGARSRGDGTELELSPGS